MSIIGNTKKILIRERTVCPDTKLPPFGFIRIYAVLQHDVIEHIEVRLNIVAKGANSNDLLEIPDSFVIGFDKNIHVLTELLIRQITVLGFCYENDALSDDEFDLIRNFAVSETNGNEYLVSEQYMANHLGEDYLINDNMVQATHMVYSAIAHELDELFKQTPTTNEAA